MMTTSTRGERTAAQPRTGPETNGHRDGPSAVAAQAPAPHPDPSMAAVDSTAPVVRPRPRRRLSGGQWSKLVVLALVLVALGGAAGFATAALLPERYAVRTELLYTLTREQPTGFLREDRNISTQLVLLESRTVLDPVAARWNIPIEELSKAIEVSVLGESEVIQLQLTDADPERARGMLSSLVARYLEVSSNDSRTELRSYLDGQLREVLARIEELRAGPASRQGELDALVDREQWLHTQLDELRFTDIAGPQAEVLVQPYVDATPVSPRPVIMTAAGATAGLLVAALVVAFVARRMTRP